jgi:hydrogenase expression/formation protein HypD
MKLLDEFRDSDHCRKLVAEIQRTVTRPWTLMEVCGGQTHGLLRYGIEEALEGTVRLLHGPGCPVCVTPLEAIDLAVELAGRDDVLLTSFGDMLRVPGSRESLLARRGRGGAVRIVYSPLDAVQLATGNREKQVVFFAVGFETTTPATALAVRQAERLGLDNFTLLVSHVRVQPAMEMLLKSDDCRIEGFLAAGHVCTVTGYESYRAIACKHRVPVVVTGFEPVDLLSGILECVSLLQRGAAEVVNRYTRSVAAQGNHQALQLVDEVYEVCDAPWRGFGVVPQGGLRLRDAWSQFDARRRFRCDMLPIVEPSECRSGDVLSGRIRPTECAAFGKSCTPDTPLGAPMVSSEGACAAYYRYPQLATGAAEPRKHE